MFEQFESVLGIIVAVCPSVVAAIASVTLVMYALGKFNAALNLVLKDLKNQRENSKKSESDIKKDLDAAKREISELRETVTGIYQKGAHDE